MKQRQRIRALEAQVEHLVAEVERLKPIAREAWQHQLVVCSLLSHLTADGACVLPLDVRKRMLEEEWGYQTEIIPIPEQPMVLQLVAADPVEREDRVRTAVAGLLKELPRGK